MPIANTRREFASRFGALDDDSARLAAAGDAHTLREISRNANYLAGLGNPLLNLVWNASTDRGDGSDHDQQGAMVDYAAWPSWRRLVMGPIPVKRKSSIAYAEVQGFVNVTNTGRLWIQFGTLGAAFDPAARLQNSNIVQVTGTGSMAQFSATGIPLGRGDMDFIDIFVSSSPTTTLMSGTYGTNTGTIAAVGPNWINITGATFQSTMNQIANGLSLAIIDSSGTVVAQRGVAGRVPGALQDTLFVTAPGFTQAEQARFQGLTYEIRVVAGFRFESLVLHEMNAWEY